MAPFRASSSESLRVEKAPYAANEVDVRAGIPDESILTRPSVHEVVAAPPPTPPPPPSDKVILHTRDQRGGPDTQLMIGISTPLRKLMFAHCSRKGLALSDVCFMVNGRMLQGYDTAASTSLVDGSVIDAIFVGEGSDDEFPDE